MSESPVEEYTIDLDNPEETLRSLRVKRIIVLTKAGEQIFSYPDGDGDKNLYRLVNAYIALFTQIEPWTMIENSGRRAYIFKDGENIVAVETDVSSDDFDALARILSYIIRELMEKHKVGEAQ